MSSQIENASPEIKELFKLANLAREKSYSPYSGHKVGAAILTSNGILFTGCNIENSSFGATVCAERVAIQKAISELGHIQITAVLVITDASPPWPPCGICRQVMGEFGNKITVYMANTHGAYRTLAFHELFPHAFTPSHLIP